MTVPGTRAPAVTAARLQTREFELLRDLIYAETGIALSPAKRVLVESRLSRRLRALGVGSFESYCEYLAAALDQELVPLINCITTNKTEFFREPHHFHYLRTQVLPAIEARAKRTGRRRLRIWSAGCSTGEEPYSLALVLRDWLEGRAGWDVRILASDIDTNVLDTAEAGCYAPDRLLDVPPDWRRRWFTRVDEGDPAAPLEIDPSVHGLVTFRRINLNDEPWPIRTTFDVVLCRNVIIYFDRQTQTRLLSRFVQLLEPDGHLIIGHSESLAWMTDLVTAVRGVPSVYTLSASSRARAERLGRGPIAAKAQVGTPTLTASSAAPQVGVPAGAVELALGDVRASASGEVLRTVLGSCIAVVLFDPESGVGGLNHFILPAPAAGVPSSTRYGVDALPRLVEELQRRGAVATRLRAKLFGGAAVQWGGQMETVGASNIACARDFLTQAGIPIVAERVGGTASIELYVETASGRARVRELRGEEPRA